MSFYIISKLYRLLEFLFNLGIFDFRKNKMSVDVALKIALSFWIMCITLTVEHYIFSGQKGKHSLYS